MTKREERLRIWILCGMTEKDMDNWDKKLEETEKATRGKKRMIDPFVGWIEKK